MSAVANEIARQIGPNAFTMMGTKNDRWPDTNALIFTVRGSRRFDKVRITLVGDDTYTVEFFKLGKAPQFKMKIEKVEGVYCDMLHDVIESYTGLFLSL